MDNLVDVLMITETWLSLCGDEVIIGEICPDGYRFCNQPRLSGSGGGVGLSPRKDQAVARLSEFRVPGLHNC